MRPQARGTSRSSALPLLPPDGWFFQRRCQMWLLCQLCHLPSPSLPPPPSFCSPSSSLPSLCSFSPGSGQPNSSTQVAMWDVCVARHSRKQKARRGLRSQQLQ